MASTTSNVERHIKKSENVGIQNFYRRARKKKKENTETPCAFVGVDGLVDKHGQVCLDLSSTATQFSLAHTQRLYLDVLEFHTGPNPQKSSL